MLCEYILMEDAVETETHLCKRRVLLQPVVLYGRACYVRGFYITSWKDVGLPPLSN